MNTNSAKKKAPVTVIMRTKNCEDIIAQTLKALFSQTFSDFHLLVVDSSSKDRTIEIVKDYPCELITIKESDYFPGKVLNDAVAATTSPLIVFLNSDAVMLTPHVLEHLLNAFENPQTQAAFGRQLARPEAEPWVQRDYATSFPDTKSPPPWMFMSMPLATMRRKIWEIRPFYTKAWGSEDTEWGFWANQEGILVEYKPKAIVMHSHNYSLKQLYGRRFIEGEADAFIFRKSYSFYSMLLDWFKAMIRDILFYIKHRHFLALWKIPFVRFINYWGYYKGYRWGKERLASGSTDVQTGQQAVLSRYDK